MTDWATVAAMTAAVLAAVAMVLSALCLRKRRRRSETQPDQRQLLERIAAGLAHELKNPLGALNLNLQLLDEELRGASLSPDARGRLALIIRECRTLEEVLDNFLRYARHKTLTLATVSLNTLVGDVITFMTPEMRRAGVALETRLGEDVSCEADEGLLKQALFNVMTNAVDAMPDGGSLTITTGADSFEAFIAVRDTGVGISAEDLPHVFHAYFSARKGGTGLGLAITRRIIESHGGGVCVQSAPGTGTEVTVTLPRRPA
jgi:signal transduction histidine kinase